MKTKNLIILGVVLVAIIGIVILSEQLGNKKSTGTSKLFFPGFSKATCSALSIKDNNSTITIKRENDSWVIISSDADNSSDQENSILDEKAVKNSSTIKNYPADSASIETVLEKISIMNRDELISQNPEKQSIFEVDSSNGILVEVFDNQNKSLGSFRIGKNGSDWSSHYVRTIGTDNVYIVSGSIKNAFYTDEKRWRDKTVLKFEKSMAKKISIAKKDTTTGKISTIEIEKSVDNAGADIWNIIAPEKAETDKSAIEKMVKELSSLKTSKWAKKKDLTVEDTGFDSPNLTVTITMENGDQKFVTVGNKEGTGSERYVKSSHIEALFVMADSRFSDIDKKLDDLKKKEEEKKEK